MNSCMIFFIIFEVMAILLYIENKFIKDTKEKNTMDDIFFWIAQGFAVVLFQLDKIIRLLGN